MTEPSLIELQDALVSHVGSEGSVTPAVVDRIAEETGWDGRIWDVLRTLVTDPETMRYVAGGDRPEEVAGFVGCWAESSLSLDEIELVLRCGGYDPDPFVALSGAGLLRQALCDDNGQVRRVGGERAGAWISDQLNMATADDVVDRVRTLIAQPPAVR
jgi:hypothetical protein